MLRAEGLAVTVLFGFAVLFSLTLTSALARTYPRHMQSTAYEVVFSEDGVST